MKFTMTILGIMVLLILVSGCTTQAPTTPGPVSTTISESSGIPDLTGTWTVKAEGGSLQKSDIPGQYSHYVSQSGTLTAKWVVSAQNGRVVQANFTSGTGKNESAIGVISMDNKNLYIADMDGFLDLHIINNDTMTLVYRHVTPNDSVASVGTWTRVR